MGSQKFGVGRGITDIQPPRRHVIAYPDGGSRFPVNGIPDLKDFLHDLSRLAALVDVQPIPASGHDPLFPEVERQGTAGSRPLRHFRFIPLRRLKVGDACHEYMEAFGP